MPSKIYKVLGWKPYTFRSNYDKEMKCIRCPKCGHTEFTETVVDQVDGYYSPVCESKINYNHCGQEVNYWAYGYYEPHHMIADRSMSMLINRIEAKLRRASLP